MKKKILSIILALTVAISMMPMATAVACATDTNSTKISGVDKTDIFNASLFTQAIKVYTGKEPTFNHAYINLGTSTLINLHQGYDFKVVAKDSKNSSFPVGTYDVKIVGLNDYQGCEVTKSVTINKYDLSEFNYSFYNFTAFVEPPYTATYNKGKTAKLGSIKLYTSGYYNSKNIGIDKYLTLKEGRDYSIKYTNFKKVGDSGKFVLTGKGNFTGTSRTYNVTIIPATPKFSVKAGKKSMTVKFSKKASYYGAQYYQVVYRVKGSTKWTSKITKKQSVTITKLKKGKKYEVFCYAGAAKKNKQGPSPNYLSKATKSQYVKIK